MKTYNGPIHINERQSIWNSPKGSSTHKHNTTSREAMTKHDV